MKLTALFIRLISYAAVLLGVYAIVAYEVSISNFSQSGYADDGSVTEWAQQGLLLLMIVISAVSARKYGTYRHIHVMLAIVAAISLVREFNNYLGDGWKVGVLAILIPAAWYFYRNFRVFRRQLEAVAETYSFAIITIGGLILHVFSRFYGHQSIWMDTLGDNYLRVVSRVAEESIELLAYSIVLIGISELYRLAKTMDRSVRPIELSYTAVSKPRLRPTLRDEPDKESVPIYSSTERQFVHTAKPKEAT